MANVAIDAAGIRPVAFDRDDTEAMLDDEAPRDGGTGPVELRCSM
jgi:hypothetical protein